MIAATNHYEVLGIPMSATIDDINAAYARAMRLMREELAAGSAPPVEHLDRLRAAYGALRNVDSRAKYDAGLGRRLFAAAPAATAVDVTTTPAGAAAGAVAREEARAIASAQTQGFHFAGSGSEYFRIWIVNLLLSLLTLMIYSAWAKVRREQYFHRNLLLDGSGFDYHATPKAILKGRAVAAVLLVLVSVAQQVGPLAHAVVIVLAVPILPWLLVRAFRFRAHNTSYRGLRLAFDGTYRQAFRVVVGYGLLAVVTLGLATPLWFREQKKFVLDNLRYGSARFSCEVPVWPVYRLFLLPIGLLILVITSVGVVSALFASVAAQFFAVLSFFAVLLAAQLLLLPYITVAANNLFWTATRLEGHRFASRMGIAAYLRLVLGNALLTVLTLGMYWPWAKVRLAAYRAAHTEILVDGSLDDFVAGETSRAAALGDEVGEMFDLDVAL